MISNDLKLLQEPELPPNYYISNKGEVFFLENGEYKPVKLSMKDGKYRLIVPIQNGSKTFKQFIHILVAKYFIPNPNNYKYIIHRDKNKQNNNYLNLYWNRTSYPAGTDCTKKHDSSNYKKNKKTIFNIEGEIWKSHPYLKNIYVSNFGRIKKNNFLYSTKGEKDHYKTVRVLNKNRKVHILVAETFLVPLSREHKIVNHIDGDRGNNFLTNLEWVTNSGNCQNRYHRNPIKTQNNYEKNLSSYNHLQLSEEEFKNQQWKQIPVLDGSFFASNMGMIKRITTNKDGTINEKIKLAEKTPAGYYECRLSIGNSRIASESKKIRKGIHKLVALAWLPNPENKITVNHIDKNICNNRLSNLEWATLQEQVTHSKNFNKKVI